MIFFATNFLSKEVYFHFVLFSGLTLALFFNVFLGPASHFEHVVVSQKKSALLYFFYFLESSWFGISEK